MDTRITMGMERGRQGASRVRQVMAGMLLLALISPALAAERVTIRVQDAWMRATPPGARVAGGFVTLVNPGERPDRLLGADSSEAERVELHETRSEGGVMRMRALPDGVTVPAHGQVVLKPGSYHLMFIQPRRALEPGMQVPVTLKFERAGTVPVTFQVRALGAD